MTTNKQQQKIVNAVRHSWWSIFYLINYSTILFKQNLNYIRYMLSLYFVSIQF